jgi:signal transduction histidine kinase
VLEAALNLASNALRPTAKVVLEYAEVPRVLGLASELTQVFVHLLMNAAQALADTHGTVTITTRLDDGRVSVTIADTGCGIAGEHLERIFEPFFTTRAPGEGTGMGLAVCYSIVHGHGGSINVHSELGKGTCFTVALPLATTDVVERAA